MKTEPEYGAKHSYFRHNHHARFTACSTTFNLNVQCLPLRSLPLTIGLTEFARHSRKHLTRIVHLSFRDGQIDQAEDSPTNNHQAHLPLKVGESDTTAMQVLTSWKHLR